MKTSYESAVAPVPAVHDNVASKATSEEASAGESRDTHEGADGNSTQETDASQPEEAIWKSEENTKVNAPSVDVETIETG